MPAMSHGFSRKGMRRNIYNRWLAMMTRCSNPNVKRYPYYGGRGIKVCDRWKKFENFYEDMGDAPFPRAHLDRIDNNKGYSKENCRWSTNRENSKNRRSNHKIIFKGETLCLHDQAKKYGLSISAIYNRVYSGKSYQSAFEEVWEQKIFYRKR